MKKIQVELADIFSFIGYEKNIQKIIEDIFINKKMGNYKGEDMKILRYVLLEKL